MSLTKPTQLRGEFFSGSAPSLPDLVLAPFIVRAKTRAARGRNTPQYRVDAAANQAYQQYAERILELDSVKATSSDPEPFIDVRGSCHIYWPRLTPFLYVGRHATNA